MIVESLIGGVLGGIIGGAIIFGGNMFLYWYETRSRNKYQQELIDSLKGAVKAAKGDAGALAKVLQFKGKTPSPDKLN